MAYLFLLFQLCAAALVLPWTGRILRLLEWISPATVEEELSRPQYIYEQALDEPETALELAEKESLRLVRHLPDFLDDLREDTSSKPALGAVTLRKAVVEVGDEVRLFVTDLIDAHQSRELLEQALNLQNRVDIVGSLAETLAEFVALSHQAREMAKLAAFSGRMAEALHLILTTGYETAENPDLENCGVLLQLTADRGEMMAQIRRGFLGERNLEPTEHQNLMTLTTLFERTVWLLRRYGTLLESQATTSSR
jgi:phosphate:Na+ symporter